MSLRYLLDIANRNQRCLLETSNEYMMYLTEINKKIDVKD